MSLIKTVRNRTIAAGLAGNINSRYQANAKPQAAIVVGKNLVAIDGATVYAAGIDAPRGSSIAVVNSGSAGAAVYTTEGANGIAAVFGGTGGSPGAAEIHELAGGLHTGTLADVQAPQFLKTDGSRDLTGNLAVATGVTIDGIDISAHAADVNAHHAQQHLLANAAGLGPDHTIAGAAAGYVLRASSSSAAAFAQLGHGDLGGITADQHHAKLHNLTDAANHSITASKWGIVGATANNTPGIITPLADVSGVTKEAILKSDPNGYLALVKLTTPTIDTASAANLTLQPAGDLILDPVGNDVLPATIYDINLGSLQKKYLTLYAAELWVETLVAQNTIATIGGRILVGPTTTLTRDLAAGATTIYVKHNQMSNGDRVYMEANGALEWMAITSSATNTGTDYSYTVTRNLDGTGANAWYAGDAMFNTGQTGNGFIDLFSLSGIPRNGQSGQRAGPTIAGNVRYSATFNDIRERWAIGNLNGYFGYGTNEYGFAAGEPALAWIGADAGNGFRIMRGSTKRAELTADGNFNIYDSAGAAVISLDNAGGSYFAGVMTIGTSGEIRQGTGALGSNYTGLRVWRDTNVGRIGGYNNNTLQWYAATDGRLYAGAGNVVLDATGLRIKMDDTQANGWNELKFVSKINANDYVNLYAYHVMNQGPSVSLFAYSSNAAEYGTVTISAYGYGAISGGRINLNAATISIPGTITTLKTADIRSDSAIAFKNTAASAYQEIQASKLYVSAGAIYSGNWIAMMDGTGAAYQNLLCSALYPMSGAIRSDYTIAVTTFNGSAYQNLAAAGITLNSAAIRSDAGLSIATTGGAAQAIYTAGVLAANSYASTYTGRIPTNGIYALGGIRSTAYLAVDRHAYNDTPAVPDGQIIMYAKENFDGTNWHTRIVFAYNEGGTIRYLANNIEGGATSWTNSTTAP